MSTKAMESQYAEQTLLRRVFCIISKGNVMDASTGRIETMTEFNKKSVDFERIGEILARATNV